MLILPGYPTIPRGKSTSVSASDHRGPACPWGPAGPWVSGGSLRAYKVVGVILALGVTGDVPSAVSYVDSVNISCEAWNDIATIFSNYEDCISAIKYEQ